MYSLVKTICAMVAGAGVVLGVTEFHYDKLPQRQQLGSEVHMYGIVRFETGGWVLLNNTAHIPQGLGDVTCMQDTGEVKVSFMSPLETVGTSSVTVDEAYAGKVAAGASVGLSAIYLTFRVNGSTVHCSSSALKISNSNVFLDVWGTVAL